MRKRSGWWCDLTRGVFFVGRAGAGKTTAADMVVKMLGNAKCFSLSDGIKQIDAVLFQQTGGKPRARYQRIGQAMREIDPDVWIRLLDKRIAEHPGVIPVIDDVRQPNEYEHYTSLGYVSIRMRTADDIRIERLKCRDGDVDLEALKHPTETALDGYECDYIIDNNGTLDELRATLRLILDSGSTQ